MRRIVFILILLVVPAAAVIAESNPINSQVIAGSDDEHIQRQIADAQKSVLSQGPGFGLIGKVEKGVHTPYSINGEDFIVGEKTEIYGNLRMGATAEVSGIIHEGNKKIAEVVTIGGGSITSPDPETLSER